MAFCNPTAPAPTEKQVEHASALVEQGNYSGAWQYLESLKDSYADNF